MEEAGAAVGIVVDDSDEDIKDIVMSDDGSGAGIRMPSMLISKKDGDELIDFLEKATYKQLEQVAILANFDMSRPDNRVEYDLWYSASDQNILDFISDFMAIDEKFGDEVLMTPHNQFKQCLGCDD